METEIYNLSSFDLVGQIKRLESIYGINKVYDISDEICDIMSWLFFTKEGDYWINSERLVKIHHENMLSEMMKSFSVYLAD